MPCDLQDPATRLTLRIFQAEIDRLVVTTPLLRHEVWDVLDAVGWDVARAAALIAEAGGTASERFADAVIRMANRDYTPTLKRNTMDAPITPWRSSHVER